jgi:hypothetical protein
MGYAYDATNKENYYRWTSTKGTIQDYWTAVRVRIPDNFVSWDNVRPIQFRYRTGSASSATNKLSVRMLDTAGAVVALTGAEGLANTSWTTATITGPAGAGTYTPAQYITLFIRAATTSSGSADAGFLNLNFETSAP